MPLGRYLIFTTSFLLVLLLLADKYMPNIQAESLQADVDRSIIRIHSEHKWPDAIVIDTGLPTIVPPQAIASEAATSPPANNAFAQIPPESSLPRSGAWPAESKRSKHVAKPGRAAVRRVASYPANDLRAVPTDW